MAEISENAQKGTPVNFVGGAGLSSSALNVPEVFDHDHGTNGTFKLFLEGEDGVFEVRKTGFLI